LQVFFNSPVRASHSFTVLSTFLHFGQEIVSIRENTTDHTDQVCQPDVLQFPCSSIPRFARIIRNCRWSEVFPSEENHRSHLVGMPVEVKLFRFPRAGCPHLQLHGVIPTAAGQGCFHLKRTQWPSPHRYGLRGVFFNSPVRTSTTSRSAMAAGSQVFPSRRTHRLHVCLMPLQGLPQFCVRVFHSFTVILTAAGGQGEPSGDLRRIHRTLSLPGCSVTCTDVHSFTVLSMHCRLARSFTIREDATDHTRCIACAGQLPAWAGVTGLHGCNPSCRWP